MTLGTPNAIAHVWISNDVKEVTDFEDLKKSALSVRALRDIPQNEEVCISYLHGRPGHVTGYDKRAERLRVEQGFECYCEMCIASRAGLRYVNIPSF